MLKHLTLIIASFLLIQGVATSQNRIQNRKTPPPKKEITRKSGIDWKQKLWYGGGFGLGFTGNSFESVFMIGVSPMIAYKITPALSVGPRVDFSYTYFGYNYNPVVRGKLNLFSYGIGPFTRLKVYQSFFVHGEFQVESRAIPFSTGAGFRPIRDVQNNLFLGIGYNQGSSELLLLYNFNATNRDYLQPPFDIRFGFTFNF
jgi:hypothetical protein